MCKSTYEMNSVSSHAQNSPKTPHQLWLPPTTNKQTQKEVSQCAIMYPRAVSLMQGRWWFFLASEMKTSFWLTFSVHDLNTNAERQNNVQIKNDFFIVQILTWLENERELFQKEEFIHSFMHFFLLQSKNFSLKWSEWCIYKRWVIVQ